MKYLLDTDICSALIKGLDPVLRARVETVPLDDVCMSVVTLSELRFGCALRRSRRLTERVEAFTRVVRTLPLDDAAAEHHAQIRAALQAKGAPIGPNDLWIAAHARAEQRTLVTHNAREFKRVPQLHVEDWIAP